MCSVFLWGATMRSWAPLCSSLPKSLTRSERHHALINIPCKYDKWDFTQNSLFLLQLSSCHAVLSTQLADAMMFPITQFKERDLRGMRQQEYLILTGLQLCGQIFFYNDSKLYNWLRPFPDMQSVFCISFYSHKK